MRNEPLTVSTDVGVLRMDMKLSEALKMRMNEGVWRGRSFTHYSIVSVPHHSPSSNFILVGSHILGGNAGVELPFELFE